MKRSCSLIIALTIFSAVNCQIHSHPLDHLTAQEIQLTAQLISLAHPSPTSWGFNYIQLKEPPKSVLGYFFLNDIWPPAGLLPRKAFAIVVERQTGRAFEAIVNLDIQTVESWKQLPSWAQPFASGEESDIAIEVTRTNPNVTARCLELGFPMDNVFMSDWTVGYIGDDPVVENRRVLQVFLFGRNFVGDNHYAHPFPFIVVVDVVAESVVEILNLATKNDLEDDNQDGVKVPLTEYQYDQDLLPPAFIRKDIKPLNIQFPEGPSYTVKGNLIEWQKFKLRIGFNAREGVVLHHVTYNDGGTVRPLIYRAALSEMVVPYGDPRPPYHRKTEFDEGGYGMGIKASVLTAGQDCIGSVHFFGGVLHDAYGVGEETGNVVCVQEEDAGILWKHTDERTHKSHVARSRRLSISFIARVDNYDYIFYWYLYQDASLQYEVKLTGILNTNLLAEGANPKTGHTTPLGPNLNAQYHQHLFAVRIDMDVDGLNNSASMVEMVAMEKGSDNPYSQGLISTVTPLTTAGSSRTNILPEHGRTWKFENPAKINSRNGDPVAYKLVAGAGQPMLMHMDSPVRTRANFTAFNVWITPFDEDQLFAAGDYIGQDEAEGLPRWVGENEAASIVDQDIVLWHVFGVSHLPRLEDWPIMPAESCGFWLKPMGFFTQNPALDVPARHMTKVEL